MLAWIAGWIRCVRLVLMHAAFGTAPGWTEVESSIGVRWLVVGGGWWWLGVVVAVESSIGV